MLREDKRLDIYEVLDPTIHVKDDSYHFLRSGQTIDYTVEPATSSSNTISLFNIFPPDLTTFVDRKLYLRMPLTIDFIGTAPPGQNLLQSQFDGLRSFPLSMISNNINLQINDVATSLNIAEYMDSLSRFHNTQELKDGMYSLFPSQGDLCQDYGELANTNRNPLASKIDVPADSALPRGAFPMNVVSNTNTTAQITSTICEPIFLSPLLWGDEMSKGLYNIRQIKITINWLNDLARIWCHSDDSGSVLNSIVVTLGNPEILVRYVQPFYDMPIPERLIYNYYNIVPHVTTVLNSLAPGISAQNQTRNLQLSSVPQRMYIYVRRRTSDRSFLTSDTFASINGISVQFGNRSGILANASPQQLYMMSRRCGCELAWTDWFGDNSNLLSGSDNLEISGTGSIVCIEFGYDIPLAADIAPGSIGNYNFNVNVNYTNIHPTETINFDIYLLSIEKGVFEINQGYSQYYLGVLTREDVLMAGEDEDMRMTYSDLHNIAGYGDFFGGSKFGDRFREITKKIKEGVKEYAPKVWKFAKEELLPFAKVAVPLMLKMLAAGEFDMEYDQYGGIVTGGKRLSRKQLKERIKRLEL